MAQKKIKISDLGINVKLIITQLVAAILLGSGALAMILIIGSESQLGFIAFLVTLFGGSIMFFIALFFHIMPMSSFAAKYRDVQKIEQSKRAQYIENLIAQQKTAVKGKWHISASIVGLIGGITGIILFIVALYM